MKKKSFILSPSMPAPMLGDEVNIVANTQFEKN